jgi:hypothetical protein
LASAQFSPPSPGGFNSAPAGGVNGMPPGAFSGNPNLAGRSAEFPNPAQPSQEPASPFSIRDDGMPNAFTELIDPRPRVLNPYTATFRGEFLTWWISKGPINADLVTTTTNPAKEIGALGQPNTQILLPASAGAIDYRALYGFRASMGLALGCIPPIEVSGFSFNRNFTVFEAGTSDLKGPFLARPVQVVNVLAAPSIGQESASVIRIPGALNGMISVESRLSLWGIDVNTFYNCIDCDNCKLDLMLGYRHIDLYESFDISTHSGGIAGKVIFGGATFPSGFSTSVLDVFRARNSFDGGQVGLRGIFTVDRVSLFSDIKCALGNTYHTLSIEGNTTLNQPVPGRPTQTLPGGLLALPSNSGIISKNEFSVVPEANVSLSFQLGQHIRIFGGCSVLYWSSVTRPGDSVNNIIDARAVPTLSTFNSKVAGIAPRIPAMSLRDFWAEGVFAGIEFGF